MSDADEKPAVSNIKTVLLARRKPAMSYGPGRNWNLFTHTRSFCSVVGCSSCTKSCPTLWFFKLPSYTKEGPRRTQWLAKIGRTGTKFFHCSLVCELHFKPTDIIKTSTGKKLKSNAIPSLCLPTIDCFEYQSLGKPKNVYQRINNSVPTSCDQRNVTFIVEPNTTAHDASEINGNNVNINALGSNSKEELSTKPSACNTMAFIESKKLTDQPHNTREEYSDELKLRIFKLYYSNAQAYEVLQNILGLPPVSSLQSFIPLTDTAVNAIYMENLQAQVSHMSANQKYCVLCLTLTRIKPFVGYDYSSDSASGFCGRISVVPVQYAVIAMARGIIFNWHYMASITLIGSLDMYKEYNIWLDNLLQAMMRIGYDVKAILTGTDDLFVQAYALKKTIINKSVYFKSNIQICHIFDPLHLMLLLYEELKKNNTFTYTEQGKKKFGNWKYITQFYELDSKRTFRLTNKTSVVNPDDWQHNKLKSVAQILSMNTATGISIYMDLNIFNEKARDTLDFIVRINKIFAALYPDAIQPEYKYTQEGNFWRDSIQFLQSIEIPSMGHSIEAYECQFIKYFCTSIESIIYMQADIFLKDHALTLSQNLNQDPLMDFIHKKINLTGFKHKYPDLKEFFEVIAGDLMNNTFKPEIDGANTDDFIKKAKNTMENCSKTVELQKKITKRDFDENYENSYTQIKDYDADSLLYVATYLLDKMCQKYRNSVTTRLTLMNSGVYYIKKNCLSFRGSVIVPDDDFLLLVYNMDAVFVNNCKRAMASGGWHEELMKQMSKFITAVPIDIASLKYVTGLFVDLRIYHSIKYNNELYEKGYIEGQQFVLRRLNSKGLNLRQKNENLL